MYSGTLGKTANCQIGVSVQLVTDAASLPANWRLYCPTSWDDTAVDDPAVAEQVRTRRARSGVPDEVRHREKWRLALDMLDQMTDDWGLPKRTISADAGYGDVTEFRLGLEERAYSYVVAVRATTSAYAVDVVPELPPARLIEGSTTTGWRQALAALNQFCEDRNLIPLNSIHIGQLHRSSGRLSRPGRPERPNVRLTNLALK